MIAPTSAAVQTDAVEEPAAVAPPSLAGKDKNFGSAIGRMTRGDRPYTEPNERQDRQQETPSESPTIGGAVGQHTSPGDFRHVGRYVPGSLRSREDRKQPPARVLLRAIMVTTRSTAGWVRCFVRFWHIRVIPRTRALLVWATKQRLDPDCSRAKRTRRATRIPNAVDTHVRSRQ